MANFHRNSVQPAISMNSVVEDMKKYQADCKKNSEPERFQ